MSNCSLCAHVFYLKTKMVTPIIKNNSIFMATSKDNIHSFVQDLRMHTQTASLNLCSGSFCGTEEEAALDFASSSTSNFLKSVNCSSKIKPIKSIREKSMCTELSIEQRNSITSVPGWYVFPIDWMAAEWCVQSPKASINWIVASSSSFTCNSVQISIN